jgi:hypothetical protein
MNVLPEETLVLALSRQLGVPKVEAQLLEKPDDRAVAKLTYDTARALRAAPLSLAEDGKVLVVAMAEPQNLAQLDELRQVTGCTLSTRVIGAMGLARLLGKAYGVTEALPEPPRPALAKVEPAAVSSPSRPPPPPAPPAPFPAEAESGLRGLLTRLEDGQRKEVAALRAMVELLIERGVFSREEYLSRIRR